MWPVRTCVMKHFSEEELKLLEQFLEPWLRYYAGCDYVAGYLPERNTLAVRTFQEIKELILTPPPKNAWLHRKVHKFIHELNLEEVPLYVNDKCLKPYAKWRLYIMR